jgi:hypothetical protein
MTPGEFSSNGFTLTVDHPIGGIRYAAHLFDIAAGNGVGFVDHGWSSGSASQPLHFIQGEVTQFPDHWLITMPNREFSRIWYQESNLPPDGNRATAHDLLKREFASEKFVPDIDRKYQQV